MGVKNINFFEQHVEKIVLAVALAGFGVMAYLATREITATTGNGDAVTPRSVEDNIRTDLQRVKSRQDNLPPPKPEVEDFARKYRTISQQQPLDSSLLVAGGASFGPRNLAPGQSIPQGDDWKIVTPAPVGPVTDDPAKVDKIPVEERLLRAQAMQVKVNTDLAAVDAQGVPVALPAGTVLPTKSVNVVVVDGYVPVGRMLKDILRATGKAMIPQLDLQKSLVYRIEVSRREQPAGGNWSDWKVVPPAKGAAAPVEVTFNQDMDLGSRMADVEASFKQILLPDFYRKEDGTPFTPPILSRPIPPSVDSESQNLTAEINAAKVGGVVVIRPPGALPGTPAPAPATPAVLTVDQFKASAVVPFTFWDETVLPDHRYQYRVEVKLMNPTYGSKLGLLDPKMKDMPTLSTGAVVIPGVVVVHSDMAFFVQSFGSGMSGPDKLSGRIYKQDNGQWYSAYFSTAIGANIETPVKLSSGQTNIDTKFTVVDCQNNTHVILRDPAGNLVTRELPDDWKKTERVELEDKVQAGAKAAASTLPAEPVPAVTPTAPPPPVRGATPTTPPARGTTTPPPPPARAGATPVPTGRGATTRP